MQKLLFTLFISLFGINQSFAQSNFIDGGIVQLNGDTLLGQIDYQEWAINPQKISFKKGNESKVKYFGAKDIAGFVINEKNEYYESAAVEINMETIDPKFLPIFESKRDAFNKFKPVRDTVFLLVLEKGELNFYEYIDKNRTHFFANKKNEPIKELVIRKVFIDDELVFLYDYRSQLRVLMGTCPSLNIDFEKLAFEKSKFYKIIHSFNKCSNNVTYIKDKEKSERSFKVLIGMGVPFFNRVTNNDDNAIKNGFEGVVPLFGGEFLANSIRKRGTRGIGLGVIGSQYSHTYKATSVNYKYNVSYLRLYGFYRQGLWVGKTSSFLKIGTGVTHFFNSSLIATSYPKQLLKNNYCFFSGIGLQKGRYSLEIQYEYNTNLAVYSEIERIKTNQISLLLGYKIFKKMK
jgi:hypothetical protein